MIHTCDYIDCFSEIPEEKDYCAIHEVTYRGLAVPINVQHECAFTIPVEWAYVRGNSMIVEKKVITVLRCVCGEEKQR